MDNIKYTFEADDAFHELEMVFVEGTNGIPYLFGTDEDKHLIHIRDFFISKFPVTQALWKEVMGKNSEFDKENNMPKEHVSWDDITKTGGFLERINDGNIPNKMGKQFTNIKELTFRLLSETEWEYAARGGKYWSDNFIYSGSNKIEDVAWYQNNSGNKIHNVGQKFPNQLGIYEMNGNIWEWCMDYFVNDTNRIPKDGSPFLGEGTEQVLRGGCHHNWAIHCTVSKRYAIGSEFGDGCIGFRLALSV